MEMWIDLVLCEDLGVGVLIDIQEGLVEVGLDSGFEEPYPTVYVFVPVFGTSKFGELRSEFISPMFYHVVVDIEGIDFVSLDADCQESDVSVTVVVEACD